ncbi:MAG: hypothetical protein CMQ41_07590 [Gammaproteobacteria bacterium]|nr:hypothetical protein [Gammaproteobacteria bacterium]
MSVIYVALSGIAIGLILAGILSTIKKPKGDKYCRVIINEKRRFNVCVKERGHRGPHQCFDKREF